MRQNHIRINYFDARTLAELAGLFQRGIDFVLVNDLSGFAPAAKALGITPVKAEY